MWLQRYREIESVGEGTYGVVIKSVHKATGTLVAIKEFKEAKDKERVLASFVSSNVSKQISNFNLACLTGQEDSCT